MTWSYSHDPRPDIQAIMEPQGCRVLDIGCAAGCLGAALKRQGAVFVAGIEISHAAAVEARSALDLVIEGDLQAVTLPCPPASFDYLVFADVLEHIADPEAVLRRFLPFLSRDGRVIVSVPNMRFYAVILRLLFDRWRYTDSGVRDRTHLRIFTRRSLVTMLSQVGLELEEVRRNVRLFEDQTHLGRLGALLTTLVRRLVAPWVFRDLLAFQYVVGARRAGNQ